MITVFTNVRESLPKSRQQHNSDFCLPSMAKEKNTDDTDRTDFHCLIKSVLIYSIPVIRVLKSAARLKALQTKTI
jgi:hypothetical protein